MGCKKVKIPRQYRPKIKSTRKQKKAAAARFNIPYKKWKKSKNW